MMLLKNQTKQTDVGDKLSMSGLKQLIETSTGNKHTCKDVVKMIMHNKIFVLSRAGSLYQMEVSLNPDFTVTIQKWRLIQGIEEPYASERIDIFLETIRWKRGHMA